MQRIVLISCVSSKLSHPAPAKDLYVSPLFRLCLNYARSLKPDAIFVLSAKHGLVALEQTLEPYNDTLNTKREAEVRRWADMVLEELERQIDLEKDRVIFLAGERYRKHLVSRIRHFEVPLQGMTIGRQLQYLKRELDHAKLL